MSVSSLEQFAYDNRSSLKYAYILSDGQMGLFDKDLYVGNVFGDQRPFVLYEFINANSKTGLDLSDYDILKLLFRNQGLLDFLRRGPAMSFQAAYEMGFSDLEEKYQTFESLYQNSLVPEYYAEIMQSIDEEWESFEKSVNEKLQRDEYVSTLERVQTTQFREEKYVKTYRIELNKFQSVYNLFDALDVTKQYPVAILAEYYKVLKGYEFTLDQIPSSSNQMYIVVADQVEEPVQVLVGYDENNKAHVDVTISVDTVREDDEVLQSILAFLKIRGTGVLVSSKFSGSFIVSQIYEQSLWMDIIMNTPIASNLFVIDEHTNASRKRESLFMYYLGPDSKTSLTIKSTPVNTLVKIFNVAGEDIVQTIVDSIVTCFGLYLETGRKVAAEYNVLLKSSQLEFVSLAESGTVFYDRPLKDVVPHMYKPNASRQCAHLPKLITNADALEVENTDPERLLKFPKDNEGQPVYNFYCDHEVYKHPGLRVNSLSNRDEFPVLPCCYKTAHRGQPQSNLNRYYNSDTLLHEFKATGDRVITRHLTTQKILGPGQRGDPPVLVSEMFEAVLNRAVERIGMMRTPYSCLECVLYILNVHNYRTLVEEERRTVLDLERLRLSADPKLFNVCSQECWDKGSDLKNVFETATYIDPRYWIRLLEAVYKCRLVLFSRSDFIHPTYPIGKSSWTQQDDTPVVYIYEHYGGEFEHREFPQYEPLMLTSDLTLKDETLAVALYNSSLVSYTKDGEQIFKPLHVNQHPYVLLEQWIDYYGKVFGYTAFDANKETRVTLYCQQFVLPPTALPRASTHYRVKVSERVVLAGLVFETRQEPLEKSFYTDFNVMQEQVDLLIENAKYKSRKLGDFESFCRQISIGVPRVYPTDKFVDDVKINVPNERVKNSLEYLVQLFMVRKKKEWLQMESRNYPEVYTSINKFRKSASFIVAATDNTIEWYNNRSVLRPVTKAYADPFFCMLRNAIYHAQPVTRLPETNFLLVIPQKKNNVRVGAAVEETYLLFNQDKKNYYYKLTTV